MAAAGFPYEGALGAASLNFGTLADLRGLNGEDTIARLGGAGTPLAVDRFGDLVADAHDRVQR